MDENFISKKKLCIENIYNQMDNNIDEQIINYVDFDSLDTKETIFLTKIILKLKQNKLIEKLLDIIINNGCT